jgi:hypothetical protein
MPVGDRTDLRILDDIALLHRRGLTPTQIHRELERKIDKTKSRGSVGLSTVKRTVKKLANKPVSGATTGATAELQEWCFMSDDTGEPGIVLDTLRTLIEQTEGRVTEISMEEARALVRVSSIAPDLSPFDWWRLAVLYIGRRDAGESVSDIDAMLAFAPWRHGNAEGRRRYDRARAEGWLPPWQPVLLEALQGSSVSNPVSYDARSTTVRRRTLIPPDCSDQDVADAGESSRTAV